jgi:thiamine-monophosphate kinase
VTSAIDISDGLSGDCAHLADASGVRIVIEQGALLATLQPDLVTVAPLLGTTPLELALSGGEDYALVVTGPASKATNWMRPIGRVERGRGVALEATDGSMSRLSGGFEH